MKKLTLGLTVAAIALAGTAYAAPGDGNRKMDRNAVVTSAEMQARAASRFDKLDVNHDGKLDQTDRAEMRAKRMKMRFERLDANRDGTLTMAEFASRPAMAEGRERGDGDMHRGHGRRHMGMRGHGMGRMADADKDGIITKAEFTAAAAQRFAHLDADKDGKVTPAERQAMREKMREHRQHRMNHDEPGQPPMTAPPAG